MKDLFDKHAIFYEDDTALKPKVSKNRSKRLRKKLFVDEFSETFVNVSYNHSLNSGDYDKLLDNLHDAQIGISMTFGGNDNILICGHRRNNLLTQEETAYSLFKDINEIVDSFGNNFWLKELEYGDANYCIDYT